MWVVTDKNGKLLAFVNPTQGKANLAYQLKQAGFLGEGGTLEGVGQNRRVTYGGEARFFVVQLPRTMGRVVGVGELMGVGGAVNSLLNRPIDAEPLVSESEPAPERN